MANIERKKWLFINSTVILLKEWVDRYIVRKMDRQIEKQMDR